MNKILTIQQGIKAARKLKKQNKTIIIAGGFFDILHPGHIKFLEAAKKYGDYLFILLEEDTKALKKGKGRPVNSQENRAKILSAVQNVDCIVLLKNMTNNQTYDKIIVEIHPDVIAVTFGDPNLKHKQRQAKLVQGKVVNVIRRIDNRSTTKYINLIANKKQ